MDSLATENLFLLEFLVDDVKMDEKCDCDSPPGEHCVSFKFLDNDALSVCEADFASGKRYGTGDDGTKNGKSCLFSLTPEQVQKAMKVFDVTITVIKKMQPGWLPETLTEGTAVVSITNLFAELIQAVQTQGDQAPLAKTLKDSFVLTNNGGTKTGTVSIYIRMSCFGKLIVTQFQMNMDDKSVLFKDKGGQSIYKYKKEGQNEPPGPYPSAANIPKTPPYLLQPNPNCPMQPCFPDQTPMQGGWMPPGMYPPMPPGMYPPSPPMGPCSECAMLMNPYSAQQPPCISPDSQMLTPCEECGTLLAPRFGTKDEATTPAPPPDPPGNYQEIGATMGGNSLTIRVHKDKSKVERVFGSEPSVESCCCTADNIGGKKAKKEIKPQALEMRPGVQQGEQCRPFCLKVGGGGAQNKNNIIVNPAVPTKGDGAKCLEISDPNKDSFVLRIGKKSEGVQKKANLELELCTPRGPDLKPIPKKETREVQYDPKDLPADKDGKGKEDKKGKKDKGDKDKKGKKDKGDKDKKGKGDKGKKGKGGKEKKGKDKKKK